MDPIRTQSIPEVVIQEILNMISEGSWKAGSQLPPQRQLAQELGVSMASLREAIQSLQGMGVLVSRHGQGTFISHKPTQIVHRVLLLALAMDQDQLIDFLDARRAVEGGLAYLAAKRASAEQINDLEDLVEGMRVAVNQVDDERFEELDISFHRLIAEMSKNDILQFLGSSLFDTLEKFIKIVPHTVEGWQRHAGVCEAIINRDPNQSEKIMHELVDTSAAYIQFLQSTENGEEYEESSS